MGFDSALNQVYSRFQHLVSPTYFCGCWPTSLNHRAKIGLGFGSGFGFGFGFEFCLEKLLTLAKNSIRDGNGQRYISIFAY